MLGKLVEVAIEPAARQAGLKRGPAPFLRGTVRTGDAGPLEAFVIGPVRPTGRFYGRVIATLSPAGEEGGARPLLVVAKQNRVCYEPQIRAQLGLAERYPDATLRCLFEKSCGVVVFRLFEGKPRFLVIKNKRGKNWGFPKGHVEYGETEIQTAQREVREETGLIVTPVEGFRAVSRYSLWGKTNKQVVFFLAESPGGELGLQASEVETASWMTFQEALAVFRFENDRRVLKSAIAWMRKNRIL